VVSNNTKIYNNDDTCNFNDKKSYSSTQQQQQQHTLLSPLSTKVILNNNDVNKIGRTFVKPNVNFMDSSRDTSHNFDIKSIKDFQNDNNISIKTTPCVQSFNYLQNVVHNNNHNEYDVVELEYEKPPIPVAPKKQQRRCNNNNNGNKCSNTAKPVINKKLFFDTLNSSHALKFPFKLYKMQYEFNNTNTNTTDNATSTASTAYTIYKHKLQYALRKAETFDDWKNKSRDILDTTSVNSVSLESMTAYSHILILQRVIHR
jgi:hypothetical protein